MLVTVIGGSGFIGTELCGLLERHDIDFEILDLCKSKKFSKKTKICDVRNFEELCANITGDTIINLAAVHHDNVIDKNLYYETNVKGADNVCRAAQNLNIKSIIFTSSVAVYGFTDTLTFEDGELNPFNDYGESKLQAEMVFQKWQAQNNADRNLQIVRPTVVFGKGNRGNVYNLMKQIRSKIFIMIGTGQNKKSLAYVENIAAFLVYLIEFKPNTNIYNYVDQPNLTIGKIVDIILSSGSSSTMFRKFWIPEKVAISIAKICDFFSRIAGVSSPLPEIRVKKFCANTEFGSSKTINLHFTAPVNLENALLDTLDAEFGGASSC